MCLCNDSDVDGLLFRKPGLTVQYEGHFGTVTAVSCHRATHPQVTYIHMYNVYMCCIPLFFFLLIQIDFSNLFLSSSIDWTVKLWNLKLINEQQVNVSIADPL